MHTANPFRSIATIGAAGLIGLFIASIAGAPFTMTAANARPFRPLNPPLDGRDLDSIGESIAARSAGQSASRPASSGYDL